MRVQYDTPIVAEVCGSHGITANVMRSVRMLVEAGAASVVIDDQRYGYAKVRCVDICVRMCVGGGRKVARDDLISIIFRLPNAFGISDRLSLSLLFPTCMYSSSSSCFLPFLLDHSVEREGTRVDVGVFI